MLSFGFWYSYIGWFVPVNLFPPDSREPVARAMPPLTVGG
jgi:hypothetical protein